MFEHIGMVAGVECVSVTEHGMKAVCAEMPSERGNMVSDGMT
ncbi:hypothetical protein [Neisseria polysaccharea]|nr:hypothetical protein [Neisseria polysaccharea]